MPTPAKTWAQQAFDRLVSDHVAPLLKRHGYKKSGLNWRLRREEAPKGWGVINIQKSQWNTRDEILFYVNLGVWWDELPASPYNPCGQSGPSDSACHVRERLSSLRDDAESNDWAIDGGRWSGGDGPDGLEPVLKTVMPLLERRGLEWIERRLSANGLVAYRRNLKASGAKAIWTLVDADL